MNRTVFLTDLRKLLTYMTEEERENTIRYYEGLFAEAGPEREDELLREFGSPTRAAVTIFREYGKGRSALDPGMSGETENAPEASERFSPESLGLSVPDAEEPGDGEEPPRDTEIRENAPDRTEETGASLPESGTETPETPEKPEITEKSPETIAEKAARIAAGIAAAEESGAEEQESETASREDGPVFVEVPVPPRTPPLAESPYEEPELRETRLPGWAAALILVLTCWLWIPVIAVLWIVVLAVFLVPFGAGLGLTAGAACLAICGIWAMGMVSDALLMFGGAAVLLALGILLLWLGIWLLIRLSGLLCRGIGGAYRGIFCRKGGKERRK